MLDLLTDAFHWLVAANALLAVVVATTWGRLETSPESPDHARVAAALPKRVVALVTLGVLLGTGLIASGLAREHRDPAEAVAQPAGPAAA